MPLQTCMTLSIVENINRCLNAPNSLQMKKSTLRVPSPAKQEILNIYTSSGMMGLINLPHIRSYYWVLFKLLSISSSILLKNSGSTNKHPDIVLNKIKTKKSRGNI